MRANFTPGRKFKAPDGTTYLVTKDGNWVRTSPRRCNESTNMKNHSVCRRNA